MSFIPALAVLAPQMLKYADISLHYGKFEAEAFNARIPRIVRRIIFTLLPISLGLPERAISPAEGVNLEGIV